MTTLAALAFLIGIFLCFTSALVMLAHIAITREDTKSPVKAYPLMIYGFAAYSLSLFFADFILNVRIIIVILAGLLSIALTHFLYRKYNVPLSLNGADDQHNKTATEIVEVQEIHQPTDYRKLNKSFLEQDSEKRIEREVERKKQNELQKKKEQELLAQKESERKQQEAIQIAVAQQLQQIQQSSPKKKEAGLFYQGVFCPSCRSLDVQFMQNKRKKFSVGKAVVGGALAGGIGAAAGLAGKKGKKNQWRCNDCGETFYSKK